MPGNSFGQLFKISTFGESHGPLIGVVIDGCPAGLAVDTDYINTFLSRRKPGQSHITSKRTESDDCEIVAGIFEGKTTGAPICIIIKNKDANSKDYSHLKDVYRPSHADFTYSEKYGNRDYKGGGRSSARETAARVAAGAIAIKILEEKNIHVLAWVQSIGPISMSVIPENMSRQTIDENMTRCPDKEASSKMEKYVEELLELGDSTGGVIQCFVSGDTLGLGEPVFDRLEADLAKGMMSINATKGFEIGGGFGMASRKGSEVNDLFYEVDGMVKTKTNFSGGVQGGIGNGMPIDFRVAFKPVASINKSQKTVDKDLNTKDLEITGRHDPCVVPRAVPIVEAMAALTILDHYLRNKTSKL